MFPTECSYCRQDIEIVNMAILEAGGANRQFLELVFEVGQSHA